MIKKTNNFFRLDSTSFIPEILWILIFCLLEMLSGEFSCEVLMVEMTQQHLYSKFNWLAYKTVFDCVCTFKESEWSCLQLVLGKKQASHCLLHTKSASSRRLLINIGVSAFGQISAGHRWFLLAYLHLVKFQQVVGGFCWYICN